MRQLEISKSLYREAQSGRNMFLLIAFMAVGMFSSTASGQCELQTIWSPEPGQEYYFGLSSAGSATMEVIVVGEFGKNNFTGTAYIYRNIDSEWQLEEVFVAADGPQLSAQFGRRADMSADGKTIIICELRDDNNGFFDAGAVWVYVEERGKWVVQQKLTASDAEDGWFFGEQIALSADGNVAAISATGAPFDPVYVFTRKGKTWTEEGKLDVGQPYNFQLPWLDVSADGSVIVVGADGDFDFGQGAGAVFIFVREGDESSWLFRQKIYASDPVIGYNFGRAPSISASGDTILVGALDDSEIMLDNGAAYIFQRQGDLWFEQVKIFASIPLSQDKFGARNKITPDGQRAIIKSGHGIVYVFDHLLSDWIETKRLTSSDPNVVGIGGSISITDDGSTALLGAPNAKVDGMFYYGAAALFDLEAPLGDLNCDGVISTIDILELFANWGSCFYWDPEDDCEYHFGCPADLDLDCWVGLSDLEILLDNWG